MNTTHIIGIKSAFSKQITNVTNGTNNKERRYGGRFGSLDRWRPEPLRAPCGQSLERLHGAAPGALGAAAESHRSVAEIASAKPIRAIATTRGPEKEEIVGRRN